jgi:hypothetical protein
VKDYTLADLSGDCDKAYTKLRERQQRLYRLARSLGFSSGEAVVLQNKNEELIRKLALERGEHNG